MASRRSRQRQTAEAAKWIAWADVSENTQEIDTSDECVDGIDAVSPAVVCAGCGAVTNTPFRPLCGTCEDALGLDFGPPDDTDSEGGETDVHEGQQA